ncbi:MAG: Asp-tRNA(Asn)/Glu-tRNA(Gln) amidotransferase subunit GatB [Chloroflexi bacterium]|nr:Asp-tRNA(Asn)/Glu-tRNA(Gln) amidotransferase subunit GatB [Chloroflexota bacterium]MCI0578324.1 Asp-tRNA(Asn)/Glu-tRNA(Gln) amidotransferase subunit GatB [Chloroflexota bacterium]MCI0649008.1 Asp-tRNA(Asn)/Glu-tRNA(Gln) amidotransferase subunit GatB [Chloroflexota bacterium]MCI0729443.1 Asp-tRNA(Asn)/Glu-tRNA(Gln) amidotransferase subunit GatB [Chloroflexota bacterium]
MAITSKYEPVIGLEVHAEMMTNSKMFCSCRVVDSVTAPPNTAVCPVCLGMPGMLPVINKRAVEFAMRVALALNCTIQPDNVFARKNYFYPDLPKGYQISQYELPLATNGWLDIALESGERRRIRIRRVHLEEDTGKLTHLEDGSGSLVDFNRSGVPLLEIVSEPDMRSVEEARVYAMKLRQILRYLGVNSGDMEKGVIRFEANVSLRPAGSQALGTRTEVKNLNSFRALAEAAAYELERQAAILDASGQVVQDTMGWSESRRETFSQRGKEEAHDYRYFPEPDLPPLQIAPAWIEAIRAALPELPDARVARYTSALGLTPYEARVLAEERPVAEWFEAAVTVGGAPKAVANWLINALFSLMNEHRLSIDQVKLTPAGLVELIGLVDKGAINTNTAKEVLAEMFASGRPAGEIVQARGLAQISDEAALAAVVAGVLAQNSQQVANYLAGKETLRGWFVGQVMKATGGKANPALVNQLLHEQLTRLEGEQ